MNIYHRCYTVVNLKYEYIPLVLYSGQFEIWIYTTGVIQWSICNMTIYHQCYTVVNLKYEYIPPVLYSVICIYTTGVIQCQFVICIYTTGVIQWSICNMTIFKWDYITVNLKWEYVPLKVYNGQFDIWIYTTGGIQGSIWNISWYHQWCTMVNLKCKYVIFVEQTVLNVLTLINSLKDIFFQFWRKQKT